MAYDELGEAYREVKELQSKLARAEALLRRIAEHEHCTREYCKSDAYLYDHAQYEFKDWGTPPTYRMGVCIGHRCAAAIAREFWKK